MLSQRFIRLYQKSKPASGFLYNSSQQGSMNTYYRSRNGNILSSPINTVVKFVPQQQAWVVERFGKFNRILEPGLAILLPLVDQIRYQPA